MNNNDEIILRTIKLSSAHYLVFGHKPVLIKMLSVIIKSFFGLEFSMLIVYFLVFSKEALRQSQPTKQFTKPEQVVHMPSQT